MNNHDYLKGSITDFFNSIINNCIEIKGDRPLEKDIFKDIISIQYQALNKTVFIETKQFNYVLSEADNTLKLCEFYRKEDMETIVNAV